MAQCIHIFYPTHFTPKLTHFTLQFYLYLANNYGTVSNYTLTKATTSICRPEDSGTSSSPSNDTVMGEYEDYDEEDDEIDEVLNKFAKKRSKKKSGRKAKWSESLLNDAVDIIVNDEYLRKKLTFENTKNCRNTEMYMKVLKQLRERAAERDENVPFTEVQLRTRFKKAVSDCKKAALTMKSASGIKRFQEEKGFGSWFNQLFALVKTRHSCQPEQAIEPSATPEQSTSSDASENVANEQAELYLPTRKQTKKKNSMESSFNEVVGMLKTMIENDPMKEYIAFAREEAEKSRQQELRLMEMLMSQNNQFPQYNQPQTHISPGFQGSYARGQAWNQLQNPGSETDTYFNL